MASRPSGLLPVRRAVLIVLDGWGIAADGPGNAISRASTPVFDRLWASYPHTRLLASGRAVGLPDHQMGNSEVGHLTLGAGAVVMQDLTRIADAARGAYERDETDEFITPVLVGEEALIRPGDSVVAFNFRPDRMREISRALADPEFHEVDRSGTAPIAQYVTMTRYEDGFPYP